MEKNPFMINPLYNFHFRYLLSFFVMKSFALSSRLVFRIQELSLWLLEKISRGSFVCISFCPVKQSTILVFYRPILFQ